jgi:hypothetical protein
VKKLQIKCETGEINGGNMLKGRKKTIPQSDVNGIKIYKRMDQTKGVIMGTEKAGIAQSV